MSRDLIELGAIIRKRQTAQAMKRLEPEIKGIREDYERQIAERDSEIERLRKKNDELTGCLVTEQEGNEALKREVAMFKDEIAELKEKLAAPAQAPATSRKGRRK